MSSVDLDSENVHSLTESSSGVAQQSLSDIYQKHLLKQSEERARIDKIRKKLTDEAANATEHAIGYLNVGVARAYINESRLDSTTVDLQSEVQALSSEAENWLSVMNRFNESLKALGDVVNWTNCINYDVAVVNKTLELVAHRSSPGSSVNSSLRNDATQSS